MSKHPITLYPGKLIDVEWDERLCIHMGECGYAKGELFVAGRDPWCEPDLTSLDEIADVVGRCPSGALVYRVKDGTVSETADAENTVQVSYNGPYFMRGDLDIEGNSDNMPGVLYRAALCRCGHSKNKPFCDNSHEDANFKDYGAIGDMGEPLETRGGSLAIKAIKDGPLMLKGNVSLIASSGRRAWQGRQLALCRCGASKNKPFCDGSHIKAGFKSD
ncbi:MAG: CDGSH iron-sulfur domain-containing protein [Gammaproteobacteria bacterium]